MRVVLQFNMDFEEHLISLVREHKILYEIKSKSYKMNHVKDKIWATIANSMSCEGNCNLNCRLIYHITFVVFSV